ncbi:MAG: O-antigen ligase family protein [Pseudomonadota bacterium]
MVDDQHPSTGTDPNPTVYLYSALFFAATALVASASSVLLAIAGVFSIWRLTTARTLKRGNVNGFGLIVAASVAFYAAGAIAVFLHPTDEKSIHQLLQRLPILLLPVLVWHFSQVGFPARMLRWSGYGAIAGFVFLSVYWLLSHQYIQDRMSTFGGNANVFGHVASVLFLFLLAGGFLFTNRAWKVAGGVSAIVCVAFALASGSRASMLAVMSVSLIFCLLFLPVRTKFWRLVVTFGIIAAIAAVAATTISGTRFIQSASNVQQTGFDFSSFDPRRSAMWSCGVKIGLTSPFIGVGHGTALEKKAECTSAEGGERLQFTHFHNLPIDQFAKGGVIALATSVFLLVLPIILLLRWWHNGTLRRDTKLDRLFAACILGLFAIQFLASMFNIGFGHDAIDAIFVYTNAMIFGAVSAVSSRRAAEVGAPENTSDMKGADTMFNRGMVLGFVLALVLYTILTAAVWHFYGFNRLLVATGSYTVAPADTQKALSAVQELSDFVERFETELIRENSTIELPGGERFHSVSQFWSNEFQELSQTTRHAQRILVRYNGQAYKILLSGPTCPIAVASGLFRSDPRRPAPYSTLCQHFAVWNEQGADF